MTGILGGLIGSFKRFAWSLGAFAQSQLFYTATYANLTNGKYFAFGADGSNAATTTYRYSQDGTTWSSGTLPNSISSRASAFNGTRLVVLAEAQSSVHYTTNGTTWTSSSMGLGSISPRQIIWDGTRFLCVTTSTGTVGLVHSTDGSTWGGIDVGNGGFSIAYDKISRYVVTSASSTSTHRTTTSNPTVSLNWTNITFPFSGNFGSVVYGNGIWIATVFTGNNYVTSTDGTTWTSRILPFTKAVGVYNRVLFYNNTFYIWTGGTEKKIIKSTDGINWSDDTSLATLEIEGVGDWAIGPDTVIGVGADTVTSGARDILIGR